MAKYFDCAVAYCNLIGGQDELVFDGRSMFVDREGVIVSQAKAFQEDLLAADIEITRAKKTDGKVKVAPVNNKKRSIGRQLVDEVEEIYQALVLGTRDYALKNRFRKAIVALSGGIDSRLQPQLP